MFNFLQYGTTAQVARATGAGEDVTAARLGAQGLWLSLAFGWRLALAVALLAGRSSISSAPKGDGGLRGHLPADRRARRPVRLPRDRRSGLSPWRLRPAHAARDRDRRQRRQRDPRARARLRPRLGIEGSAWGTVVAQTGMGVAMAIAILRRVGLANAGLRPALARRLLSLGKFIFIRTVSLIASFVLAGVVVTRHRRCAARRAPDRVPALDLHRARAGCDRDRRADHRRAGARRIPSRCGLRRERADDLALDRRRSSLQRRPARLSGVIPRAFTSDAEVLTSARCSGRCSR